jgi:hypothetical protein
MAESEEVFSGTVKYTGIYSFKEFYKFSYDWLLEELSFDVQEGEYGEKIVGDGKDVKIKWKAEKKVTDYFKFIIKVTFEILGQKEVEANRDGVKVKTNKGELKIKIKGELQRDYDSKFEQNAFTKFWRSIYDKYIIPARIKQYENDLIGKCDGFANEMKAFLALEGRK